MDEKFVRMILFQAFGSQPFRPTDIYRDARCLRDTTLKEWEEILKYLEENNLVEESEEPEYYKMTREGTERYGW